MTHQHAQDKFRLNSFPPKKKAPKSTVLTSSIFREPKVKLAWRKTLQRITKRKAPPKTAPPTCFVSFPVSCSPSQIPQPRDAPNRGWQQFSYFHSSELCRASHQFNSSLTLTAYTYLSYSIFFFANTCSLVIFVLNPGIAPHSQGQFNDQEIPIETLDPDWRTLEKVFL